MTAFDLIAFGIVFVCAAISAMRGLVGELVSFAGWIAALAAAWANSSVCRSIVFLIQMPSESMIFQTARCIALFRCLLPVSDAGCRPS